MKILQLVTQAEAGGAQRVAYLLAQEFHRRGYDSNLWFLYRKRAAYDGLSMVRSLWPERPGPFDQLRIAGRLVSEIRRERPDIVITHTHYANVMGQCAASLCGISRRIAVHHNPLDTYPRVARLADFLLCATGAYTNIVAVSDTVIRSMDRYPRRFLQTLQRIYNGVTAESRSASAANLRSRWELPAENPLLLNIGRLAHQKNQQVLLDVLARMPQVHLALVGDGELRQFLSQRAEELGVRNRVHFLGELDNAEIPLLLAAADIFVFPSLYEAMPLALVEAMRAGIPIVASDIPAHREILAEGGVLTQSGPVELALAVSALIGSAGEKARLTAIARRRAELFTVERMVYGYERLFENETATTLA
jgi:glycosyltransferase involved in cell wall biosynthesis